MYNNFSIGVVILNYNDAETAIELLNYIKNYKTIDRIVVVDNLSSDNSYCKLKHYENHKIDIIQSNRNGGYAYGNNLGAFYLINKYDVDILFIANPDVKFDEEFVIGISKNLSDEKSNIVAATGRNINEGENFCEIYPTPNSYFRDLLQCTILLQKIFKRKFLRLKPNMGVIIVEILLGALFAIKSNVFFEIGGFDENTFLYKEEEILAIKLKEKNYQMAINTQYSYIHKESVSINKCIDYYQKRKILYNSLLYYYKNYKKISKIKYLILKVAIAYGLFARKITMKMFNLYKLKGVK